MPPRFEGVPRVASRAGGGTQRLAHCVSRRSIPSFLAPGISISDSDSKERARTIQTQDAARQTSPNTIACVSGVGVIPISPVPTCKLRSHQGPALGPNSKNRKCTFRSCTRSSRKACRTSSASVSYSPPSPQRDDRRSTNQTAIAEAFESLAEANRFRSRPASRIESTLMAASRSCRPSPPNNALPCHSA